jgi:hypothetical protein
MMTQHGGLYSSQRSWLLGYLHRRADDLVALSLFSLTMTIAFLNVCDDDDRFFKMPIAFVKKFKTISKAHKSSVVQLRSVYLFSRSTRLFFFCHLSPPQS